MGNFFSKFPVVAYDMDGQGSKLALTNIVKNVDVNDFFANHSASYTYYDIIDGERPDTISYKLYGNPNYYWTFFIINNDLRNGLNSAWPMSLNHFERMIEQEYDPYSAITFLPAKGLITGMGTSGLMHLAVLDKSYLPYLRLTDGSGTLCASVLKYDNSLLQTVIHDIEYCNGSGSPSSISGFMNSPYYKLLWNNPYDQITEEDQWNEVEALRVEYVSRMLAIYGEFDPSAVIDNSIFDELTSQEDIDAAIADTYSSYVFDKQYVRANQKWNSYRDAAAEYYIEVDGVATSVSAFDVFIADNIVVPSYISFYEKERIINDRKEKIRVVRPDRMNDFVTTYFEVLNG